MYQENKKILIVEDDATLLNVLRDKFSLEGFNVIVAKNGEEGLTIALKEHPDIILLDIVMPKMDGVTMMKKLRQTNEWGKHVPIVLLTNLNADNDDIMKAITDYEPTYFLVKANWTINEIVEKIRDRIS